MTYSQPCVCIASAVWIILCLTSIPPRRDFGITAPCNNTGNVNTTKLRKRIRSFFIFISSKEIFNAFSIKCLEAPGFEADDIIGTVASKVAEEKNAPKVIILSGDLDILQLVKDGNIIAWVPKKGISSFTEYDKEAVIGRFDIPPELVPDFKGLVGDISDNIPGIQGVGPKTAADIIKKYGPLEDLYDLAPQAKTKAMENVMENKKTALLSKKLATIDKNVPIPFSSVEDFKVKPLEKKKISDFLLSKGFKNLSERALNN